MAGKALIWLSLAGILCVPIAAAMASPLLAWRNPIYIAAGFAGIIGFALMALQPLAVQGLLPGLSSFQGRRVHRWLGAAITIAVLVHVVALWITSPPDVVDALLLASPTPFSVWGVLAMWAIVGSAGLAILRVTRRLRWAYWHRIHPPLAVLAVAGTILHVLLIEGTMEPVTKVLLCLFAGSACLWLGLTRRLQS